MVSLLIYYRDETTLGRDTRIIWNSKMVGDEVRLRKELVQIVEEALPGEAPKLVAYYMLEEKYIYIGPERLVRIITI